MARATDSLHRATRLLPCILFCAFGYLAKAQAPVYFVWKDTFCSNQLILVNNNLYGPDQPSGTEVLPGAATTGGDSIIIVEFTFLQPAFFLLEQALCAGDTIRVNGAAYHENRRIGTEKIFGGAANGCDSTVQIRLTILPNAALTIADTLCAGEFVLVNGVQYDESQPEGTEILPAAAANGCDSTVHIQLSFKILEADLGADQTIGLGDTICLHAICNFAPSEIVWTPDLPCADPTCAMICLETWKDLTLTVEATDVNGCSARDTARIRVEPMSDVYAPNVFMPEADAPNNRFFIQTDQSIRIIRRLAIADRWGNLLLEIESAPPNDPDAGWDGAYRGSPMPPGAYVWIADLETLDGRVLRRAGSVGLIR
jgi:gliding motility-associated-like protein